MTRICDKCNNLQCHPSGVNEYCWQTKKQTGIDIYYAEERLSGIKNNCKRYEAITAKEIIK